MFDFLLVGPLSNYLAYVIVPFKELGQWGIGMGRGKFSLAAIDAIKADGSATPVFRKADGVVRNAAAAIDSGELVERFSLPMVYCLRHLRMLRFSLSPFPRSMYSPVRI